MNHTSAQLYPDHIDKYIQEEVGFHAMLGPLDSKPFDVHISPFMSWEKYYSNSRRTIMDLFVCQLLMESLRIHTWVLIFRCIVHQSIPLYEL